VSNPQSSQVAARRTEGRATNTLRSIVRYGVALALVAALSVFLLFWRYVSTGQGAAYPRPDAADVFLPFAGFAQLKLWFVTGVWDHAHPAAGVVLLAVVVTAWLFRRAACSWLCPFGIVAEFLASLGRRIFGRNFVLPRWLDRALLALKYVGTFVVLWWFMGASADALRSMMARPFYVTADAKVFELYAHVGPTVLIVISAILLGSVFVKSFWCRYLCPYGAIQGIFAVLSPLVLVKNDSTCTNCGRCNKACMNVVDVAGSTGAVVSGECMGCTACVQACPRPRTLEFKLFGLYRVSVWTFGVTFVALFAGIVIIAALTGSLHSTLTPDLYRQVLPGTADVRLPL